MRRNIGFLIPIMSLIPDHDINAGEMRVKFDMIELLLKKP